MVSYARASPGTPPIQSRPAERANEAAHVPELDGIRGIAIVLVLLFHGAKRLFDFGWMGVDLFFVLSGFLITLGLLKTSGRPHYFRNFYVKRALRIWPLYYLLLAYVFLLLPALGLAARPSMSECLGYGLYLQNFLHPLTAAWELGPTWSLAIEEHFYLVWPLVVFFLPRPALKAFALAIVVAALALRVGLTAAEVPAWFGYFATPCRVDALAAGALLSLAVTGAERERLAVGRWSAPVAITAGTAAIALALWLGSDTLNGSRPTPHPVVRAVLFSLVCLASAGFVGLATTHPQSRLSAQLRARWLRYCGKISYGIYIYHMVLFQLVLRTLAHFGADPDAPLVKFVRHTSGLALTFAVASISWYALERPILGLKAVLAPSETGPVRS